MTLRELLARIHGADGPGALDLDGSDPEYQRARRFVTNHPDHFLYESDSGVAMVRPTLDLVSLIFRGITQNPGESGYTAGIDWCEQMLRAVRPQEDDDGRIRWSWGDSERWHLEKAFEDYVRRCNRLKIILERREPDAVAPDYIGMDYKTRFTDAGRAEQSHAVLNRCLEKAGERYDAAIFGTLTIRPSHYAGASLWDAIAGDERRNEQDQADGINKCWNRFMSWISTDSRLGYRPDYVKVLEFQGNGSPHLHYLIFLDDVDPDREMPFLMPKGDLDDYWSKWTGGFVNDLQPLAWRDDLPDEYRDKSGGWVKWQADRDHGGLLEKSREASEEDGDGRTLQTAGEYLGKYLSATIGAMKELGGTGESETFAVTQEADDEGRYPDKAEPWKIALYWATRRKIKTVSRSLRQAVEEDFQDDEDDAGELADLLREARYEVVGAFTPEKIPDHIRSGLRDAEEVLKPPDDDTERLEPNGFASSQTNPPPDPLEDRLVNRSR
jgi:hypothetical protein